MIVRYRTPTYNSASRARLNALELSYEKLPLAQQLTAGTTISQLETDRQRLSRDWDSAGS
jgi:hypothetical protein